MAKWRLRQLGPDLFDLLPPPRPRLGPTQLDAHCWVEALGQAWRIVSIPDSGMAYVRTRNGLGAADIHLRPPAPPIRVTEAEIEAGRAVRCEGCGAQYSLAALKIRSPNARSCCPERSMVAA